jgi:hypothetical protein
MSMLIGDGRMPAVAASASILAGGESLFARLEVDDMPSSDRPRHAVRFSLIGTRAAVRRVLAELLAAVDAAQVELPNQQ